MHPGLTAGTQIFGSTITRFNLRKNRWYYSRQTTNPDVSGMLRFVTDELRLAEDNGQSVYFGFVPGAWLGYIPVPSFIPFTDVP